MLLSGGDHVNIFSPKSTYSLFPATLLQMWERKPRISISRPSLRSREVVINIKYRPTLTFYSRSILFAIHSLVAYHSFFSHCVKFSLIVSLLFFFVLCGVEVFVQLDSLCFADSKTINEQIPLFAFMNISDDARKLVRRTSSACGHNNADLRNEDETIDLTISVVNKKFWTGKNSVKVSDLECAHAEVTKLEDGVNRAIRALNRCLNQKTKWLTDVVSNANSNFDTLKAQLDTLADRVDELERTNDGTEASSTVRENDPDSSQFLTPGNKNKDDDDAGNGANANAGSSAGGVPVGKRTLWGINMLSNSLSISSNLELFGDESVFAFDDWAERFKDYISVSGKNWSEEEKVTRLKLALKDSPRALFKELDPSQTDKLNNALVALRAKLDSPQRRELAKRTLALCKQREDETVAQFLRRLTPLVEATNPSLTGELRKEKVCEEFLDRLKPNMSFLIRLVGLSQTKNLEMVKAQAQELEALLLGSNGDDISRFSQLVNALKDQSQNVQPNSNQNFENERDAGRQNGNNTWGFRPFTQDDVQRRVPMHEILEPISDPLTMEECKQMIDHGKCSLGVLFNESGLLHTDNRIDMSPRMWLFGSFSWSVVSSENCYLFRTKITTKHGERSIRTSLGEAAQCSVEKGKCHLSDNTLLIWETNVSRNCEYQSIGTWKGMQMDNIWISDEASFRLSFPNESQKVYSCGNGLELTEEGFAVRDIPNKAKKPRRKTRSLVTESEMQTKLGYLDEKVMQTMKLAFICTGHKVSL